MNHTPPSFKAIDEEFRIVDCDDLRRDWLGLDAVEKHRFAYMFGSRGGWGGADVSSLTHYCIKTPPREMPTKNNSSEALKRLIGFFMPDEWGRIYGK